MAITDKFSYVGEPGSATYLASPGYTMGGTSINLQTYVGWPTGKVIFDMYTAELIGQTEQAKAGTRTSWQGIHNGSGVISSLQRLGGNDQNYPAASSSKVVITHSAYHMNQMVDGIANQHNLSDGSHKGITTDTLTASGAVTAASFIVAGSQTTAGWLPVGASISGNPTYNGNRSHTLPFSADMSTTLSQGMRLLLDKTVAGNAYMGGALNGTSQYFTKTSPTGALGTVTNNFTIEAVVQPTSYTQGVICGRVDAAVTNALRLGMNASGQVELLVINNSGNSRYYLSYQSLPLNKKTHVAATWQGGTAYKIYFDGVEVPITAAITGGTAPTTAGMGGDWSIGRNGAANSFYFAGYISNVAVFDAVLSQATIKQHATYKLTGSETNCIGAWSLDNTVNDQSSLGNNLTAQGSAGFTAMSPHGQLGNGVQASKAVALVMDVSGANVTVQVPEGVTIPTTGGISAVSYATSGNPFGWVSDKDRWEVATVFVGTMNSTMANGVWTRPQDVSLSGLTGLYTVGYSLAARGGSSATSYINLNFTLSTSASAETDASLTSRFGGDQPSVGTMTCMASGSKQQTMVLTPGTVLYPIMSQTIAGTSLSNCGWTSASINKIYAIPAGI
jgi:hypothetical protein